MKIYLGADHGGFQLKEEVKKWLLDNGYQLEDCGAHSLVDEDDYPEYAFKVAEKVTADQESIGILFCRSGGGMSMAANKVKGVRAVDVFDLISAVHAKTNDNANIITLGGDWTDPREAKVAIENFLNTPFGNEPRHLRRIEMIHDYEEQHS